MEFELDDILMKEPGELSEEEAKFLADNIDSLDDVDRDYYADVLKSDTGDGGEGKEVPKEEGEDKLPFKTREEAEAWLNQEVEKRLQEKTGKEEEEEKEEKLFGDDERIFPEGFKVTEEEGWEKVFRTFIERAWPRMSAKQRALARESIEKSRKELDREIEKLNQEYDDLARANNLPSRTSEDGAIIYRAIASVGAKYNQPDIKSSFELWQDMGRPVPGSSKKSTASVTDEQKRLASLTGGGPGKSTAGEGKEETLTYKDIHETDIDTLVEKAMEKEGIL